MSVPLLSIRGVCKTFPGVIALEGVTFDVREGELHAIVGENGAGKSTLMKILAGIHSPDGGELFLRGTAVQFRNPREAVAAGVGIIHQELNLIPQLSVAANVFLGREPRGVLGFLNDRRLEREAEVWLQELECSLSPAELVSRLRVGDQQLVEIARALSQSARILIMDEPTSALTESEVARLDRVIARLRGRGVTILYISHKMDEVFRLADRITVLRDGRLVQTVERSKTSPREVVHLMVGREIESASEHDQRTPGEVILDVRHLSLPWREHARQWRLHDVSFTLRRGEVLGIAGLLGAGRTELLECLFGASTEPPQGDIVLDGVSRRFRHPREARNAGMALITEDRKRLGLFDQFDVQNNISLCALRQAARVGIVDPWKEQGLAESMVTQLGVKTASLETPITTLSGGNQQKCIIGRWLLTKPRVLLLDDPTRGVDVGAKAELYRLIDRLCRGDESGNQLGVIVTSSELPELLLLCDRILVLSEGRLTAEFSRKEATEQRIIEAATRGRGVAG